jgi:hypothetical protein
MDLNFIYRNCFLGKSYQLTYDSYFSKDIENGTIVGFEDFKHSSEEEASYDDIY